MKKIYENEQPNSLEAYLREALEIIHIINESYGAVSEGDKDLGGYLLATENILDILVMKNDTLIGLEPEYSDTIQCNEGVKYTYSLFYF